MITITGTGVNVRKGSIISGCRQYGLELLRWNILDNGICKAFLKKAGASSLEGRRRYVVYGVWCVTHEEALRYAVMYEATIAWHQNPTP